MITTKLALGLAAAVAVAGITTALVVQSQSPVTMPATAPAVIAPHVPAAPRAPVPPAVPLSGIASAPTPRPASRNIAPVSNVGGGTSAAAFAPSGSGTTISSSRSVSVENGLMTITTTENGVTTTQTVPVPASGVVTGIVGPDPNNPNVGAGAYMADTLPDNRSFSSGSSNGTVKISNGIVTVTTTDENGQTSTQVIPAGDYQSTLTITAPNNSGDGGGGSGGSGGTVISTGSGNP